MEGQNAVNTKEMTKEEKVSLFMELAQELQPTKEEPKVTKLNAHQKFDITKTISGNVGKTFGQKVTPGITIIGDAVANLALGAFHGTKTCLATMVSELKQHYSK